MFNATCIMYNPFKKNKKVNAPAGENDYGHGQCIHQDPINRGDLQLDPEKAHIYNLIIVDESGSMSGLKKVTIDGINETISAIKKAQEDYGDKQQHFLTLVTFDQHPGAPSIRTHLDAVPIADVHGFNDYQPRGCTPLLDAMGESLTTLHERVKNDENATGVVTIITDGLENASRHWSGPMVRQLIERLKEEGWAFSYMGSCHDVLEVTMQLSIDHVVEFEHDVVGTSNTWHRDNSSKRAFFRRIHRDYDANETVELKRRKMRDNASAYYANRVTPDMIEHLEDNEVFVFGSDEQGNHAGGAAAYAMDHFGAVMGQGEGLQGQSYAIPTTGGFGLFAQAVQRFIDYAATHPDQRFLVTRLGCGRAGYNVRQVAMLFTEAIKQENICLPEEFWHVLGLKMN